MDYEFLSEFESNEEDFFCDDVDDMNSQLAMDVIELELDLEEF